MRLTKRVISYIPMKVDYTDFFDIMAFFAGDMDGKNGHDALARQIGQNGKEYAAKFWRFADMEACSSLQFTSERLRALTAAVTDNFRLAIEWARLTADDRKSMDYLG